MIKNDKQLQVTKSRLKDFSEALVQLERTELDPLRRELHTGAIKSQIEEFEEEIAQYEQLKKGKLRYIYIDSLSRFYEALIKARMNKGWTQAKLANQLDMKEQQIQRYELNDYETASISRISEVASALSLEIVSPIKIQIAEPAVPAPPGFDDAEILQGFRKMKKHRNERGYFFIPEMCMP